MTIIRRFFLLTFVAAAGLVATSLIGIVEMRRLHGQVQAIEGDSVKPLVLLARLDNALLVTRVQALAGQMHDPGSPLSKLHDHPVDLHRGALAEASRTLREAAAELKSLSGSAGGPAAWRELAEAVLTYEQQVVQRSDALLASGGWFDVASLITLSNRRYTEIKQQLDASVAQASAQAQQHVQSAAATVQRTTVLLAMAGLAIAGVLGLVVMAALRSLRRSVATAELLGQRLQGLELRPVPDADCSDDEIGCLCRHLNATVRTLSQTFGQLRSGAAAVFGTASEIADSSLALSQRTEAQAGNLQQTASATEQISATVQNTADVARQAHELAASASNTAGEGRQATTQVVQTMGEIAERSQRIGEIIGTIDSIAFQTNILALNAAVEAARAGEQGRGFAVVAAEVRQLAQRSAQAAGEIKRMIEDSAGTVERGVAQVQQAGQTIRQLVDRVQAVGSLIDQIAHASAEQAAGVKLMTGAVHELEGVTQQNAAMVEQAAAAAENLRDQARQVDEALARFRLAEAA